MFIDFRERNRVREGREKERNIDFREKHRLVASLMCSDQGLNPQHFGVQYNTPTNSHLAGARMLYILKNPVQIHSIQHTVGTQ